MTALSGAEMEAYVKKYCSPARSLQDGLYLFKDGKMISRNSILWINLEKDKSDRTYVLNPGDGAVEVWNIEHWYIPALFDYEQLPRKKHDDIEWPQLFCEKTDAIQCASNAVFVYKKPTKEQLASIPKHFKLDGVPISRHLIICFADGELNEMDTNWYVQAKDVTPENLQKVCDTYYALKAEYVAALKKHSIEECKLTIDKLEHTRGKEIER